MSISTRIATHVAIFPSVACCHKCLQRSSRAPRTRIPGPIPRYQAVLTLPEERARGESDLEGRLARDVLGQVGEVREAREEREAGEKDAYHAICRM